MADMLTQVLTGATLQVESSVSIPLSVDLTPQGGAESIFMKLLRPRLKLLKNGEVIVDLAPYGDPSELRTVFLLAAGVFCLLLFLRFRK